jgi:hypothetical protein
VFQDVYGFLKDVIFKMNWIVMFCFMDLFLMDVFFVYGRLL